MRLNEAKTKYIIFSRAKSNISTRITVNDNPIERKQHIKILGMWLQEDGGWSKNTQEYCKKAYSRLSMLTKLKYAGVQTEDLITIYKLFIRSTLEYNSVAFHSSLTSQQENALERCQSVCLKVILSDSYISYNAALEMSGLETLKIRREKRCLDFSLKCVKHPENKRIFPLNENNSDKNVRSREKYKVNFAFTTTYKNSALPYCQRLLNHREEARREEERGGGGGGGGEVERRRRSGE